MSMPGIDFDDDGKLPKESGDKNAKVAKQVWEYLQDNPNVSNGGKFDSISALVRKWTAINTTNGKYRGVPYWTPAAYERYQELWEEHNPNLTSFSKVLGREFTHEHILPVDAAVRLFKKREDNELTEQDVRHVLYNDVNAAVVTKDEAKILDKAYQKTMPESFYKTGVIFSRYEEVDFSLLYVTWTEGNEEMNPDPQKVDLKKTVLENHWDHHWETSDAKVQKELQGVAKAIMEKIMGNIGKPKEDDDSKKN